MSPLPNAFKVGKLEKLANIAEALRHLNQLVWIIKREEEHYDTIVARSGHYCFSKIKIFKKLFLFEQSRRIGITLCFDFILCCCLLSRFANFHRIFNIKQNSESG